MPAVLFSGLPRTGPPRGAIRGAARKITAATEICVVLVERVCYQSHKLLNEEEFVVQPVITKYGFRIRTRSGLIVDKLLIHGRDEVDAERKLRQMYQHCRILQCTVHKPGENAELSAAG